jgi:hypothetical protein
MISGLKLRNNKSKFLHMTIDEQNSRGTILDQPDHHVPRYVQDVAAPDGFKSITR